MLCNSYVPPNVYGYSVDIAAWLEESVEKLELGDSASAVSVKKTIVWLSIISFASIAVALVWSALARLKLKLIALDISLLLASLGYKSKKRRWYKLKRRFKHASARVQLKSRARIILMGNVLNDSPLDALFYRSFTQEVFLMLTLSDRKVYVGRVISLGEPTESEGMDQEITIAPFLSGYRNKDTLNITFTTKYGEVSKKIPIVIRQELICSATEFDKQTHDDFEALRLRDESQKSLFRKGLNLITGNSND